MGAAGDVVVLRNGHVIDPAQGIDRVADIAIVDGKIASVGAVPIPPDAKIHDLSGRYVTPGWIDLHVHAYGTLGFGDLDSIGVYQGVTSFVDAGGAGVATIDELATLARRGVLTSLYAGPYIYPLGIVGLSYFETQRDVEALQDVPIARWLDCAAAYPGMMRYVKVGAYSAQGSKPIAIAKHVARTLGLPLYLHIGEYGGDPQAEPPSDAGFAVAEAGDIVTHIYHGNRGAILDGEGKVLPFVRAAQQRGILFDIGFGGYNFSWNVAEKAYAQGIAPHIISSDLQQFNVMTPCRSLANVMSIHLRLGMGLAEVVAAVTAAPAAALSLNDCAGSLRVGLPADLTVFAIEDGAFALEDCFNVTRTSERRIIPTVTFKSGKRIECDLSRAQDERNWFMQISEDDVPARAGRLSPAQCQFLGALAHALKHVTWECREAQRLELDRASTLLAIFHAVRQERALALSEALDAVYSCFLANPFPMQIGLFLLRLDRDFAIARLCQVSGEGVLATA
jgi:dihydroorotase